LIRALPIVALLALGCGPSSSSPDASTTDAGDASIALHVNPLQLQAALDSARVAQDVAGAVALVRVGTTTWRGASGFANVSTSKPMTVDGLFRIGSTTKSFVATVILQLVAEGKLSLDATLDAWVPSVPNASSITVRALLNHTSGIFNYTDSTAFTQAVAADPQHVWAPMDLVNYAIQQPASPYFAPGQGFHYSNTNFILLGIIIEQITAQRLPAVIRARILTTLSLSHTFFTEDETIASGTLVEGYHRMPASGGFSAPTDVTYAVSSSFAWAAGALVSNVDDDTAFFHALVEGNLLEPSLLAQMETPGAYPTGTRWKYGLGMIIRDSAVGMSYGHGGHAIGYYTWAMVVPSVDLQITLLLNDELDDDDVDLDRLDAIIGALGATLTQ
jgi:D-alanyl-D-alanine carboxypeptidase